jgi:hypothetical protein
MKSSEAPVVKTTTYREVVPPSTGKSSSNPDYWEFTRELPEGETIYTIYLSRSHPSKIPIDHTSSKYFDVPTFGPVPSFDQEALEFVIGRMCGGGEYKLTVKIRKTSAWVTSTDLKIDLPTKAFVPWSEQRDKIVPANGQHDGSSDGSIAAQAMNIFANRDHAAITLALNTLNTAGGLIKTFADTGPQDGMSKRVMELALERLLNPPPPPPPPPPVDPIELLSRVLTLQSAVAEKFNLNSGGGAGGGLVSKIVDAAVARFLEPPMNPNGPGSFGAELVRVVPSLVANGSTIAENWRLGKEAERDAVAMSMARPQPQPMPPPRPLPQPTVAPPPPPGQPPQGGQMVPPSTEFVEARIVEILRQPMSAEEAASRVLEFLYTLSGPNPAPENNIVKMLAERGETKLMELFQERPVLRPALQWNSGRVTDFIRAFVRFYREEQGEQNQPGKPN